MLEGYKTFREYVEFVEGTTVRAAPGVPAVNPDQEVDDEIAANPQALMPKNANPALAKPIVDKAVANRNANRKLSMDAALKAAAISQKRLDPNSNRPR